MASYDGEIVIKTTIETKDAEKQIRDLGDTLDNASDGALSFSDVLKGNLLSEVIVNGIRTLAYSVKDIATNFIESAAAVKAETSQFEQTFGELQDSATEAIGGVAETSGILETRLNTLGSQIYAFARSSGGDTEESMALMETALQAAADGAAYYDRSLEDVTETLQSFLKGNFENDAALGVSATETTRNAAAMELFGEKYEDLTEIQKQQTLLKMVTDAQELSGAMGQAAREADGWENVQGNLNEAWRQFMARTGAPLLESLVPIIQDITSGLMEWTASIDWASFSNTIKGFVSAIVDNGSSIMAVIAGVGAGFVTWNVVTMIQGVVAAINAFRVANDGLKLSQIALNAVMNANPLAIIATLIAGVVTALIVLWNTNEDFRNAVKDIWEDIKQFFVDAWEGIKETWDVVKGYFQNIWNTIETAFEPVKTFFELAFSSAWTAIKAVWDDVSDYFSVLWGTIKGVFSVVEAVLSGDFQAAWDAIKAIIDVWGEYFSGIWADIKNVFSDAWEVFKDIGGNIVDGIKQGISNAWDKFTGWVSGKFNGMVDGVKSLLKINSPSKVFEGIGGYIMEGLTAGIDDGSKAALKSVENVANSLISAAKISLPTLSLPGIETDLIPDIARGVVLPRNIEFAPAIARQQSTSKELSLASIAQAFRQILNEGGYGGNHTVIMEVDGREFGRVTYNAYNSEAQRLGVSLGGA